MFLGWITAPSMPPRSSKLQKFHKMMGLAVDRPFQLPGGRHIRIAQHTVHALARGKSHPQVSQQNQFLFRVGAQKCGGKPLADAPAQALDPAPDPACAAGSVGISLSGNNVRRSSAGEQTADGSSLRQKLSNTQHRKPAYCRHNDKPHPLHLPGNACDCLLFQKSRRLQDVHPCAVR